MAELKTKRTAASVTAFLKRVADDSRRRDCLTVLRIMKQATKAQPRMWGSRIVGFGSYRYTYSSGREAEWFLTGFAPRKQDLTLYIMAGVGRYKTLLAKLGKYKTGGSCLYIKRLADVNVTVLRQLVSASVRRMKQARR
jgi:hypothetical protein